MNSLGLEKTPAMLIAGIAVILIGAALAAWWLLASRDVVLFDALEPQHLDAVSAELDRAGIRHESDRQAGTLTVAPEDERRARLAVMSSGNAFRESVGFELFDGSDFGMTEFAQKINYQRAIEGELARTISALDEIKYARVHLVLPEHGLFSKQQREPRAAITVFLENGATLTPGQIRGLQRIAAAAVPELAQEQVAITDESGRILSAASPGEGAPLQIGARLAQKQAVERYLANKVRGVLAKALGAQRFAVSVDAVLDFTHRTTRTERVLDAGDGTGIKRIKESTRGDYGEGQAGGRLKEVEYSLGHEVEQVEQLAGSIQRVQVGVIIDRDIENVDLAQLRELIAAAVGIDAARGDKVAVVQHGIAIQRALEQVEQGAIAAAPAMAAAPAAAPAGSARAVSSDYVRLGVAAVLLLLGIVGVALVVRRAGARRSEARIRQLRQRLQAWIETEPPESDPPGAEPADAATVQAGPIGAGATGPIAAVPAGAGR